MFSKPQTLQSGCVVAVSLWLSACMPAHAPVDLAIPAPPRYEALHARTTQALTKEWPQLFGSKELEGLINLALRDNPDIGAALARIDQAQALTQQAESLLLPTVNGSFDAGQSMAPGTLKRREPPFNATRSKQFSTGASASYLLDIWGRYRSLYNAQQAEAQASLYDHQSVMLATASAVTNSYFVILSAQDRIALGRENIATAQRILDAIRGRLSVGTASALDVAQQESVLAAQKALIPQLQQQASQTRNQLAVLLGRPPEGFTLTAKSLNGLKVPMVQAGLPSDLLRQRPDLARAEAQVLAASANVEASRAAFLPSFSLTASGGLESMTLKTLLNPHAAANSLLAGVSQPLFDGGNLKAQYQGETAREAETLAISRKTVLTALSDVENALVAVEQSRRQEVLQQEVVTASRRATMISEERLKAGTIDIVTLLAVQQSLFQAQENLLSSRLQRLQASLSLIEALGGGFQKPDNGFDDGPALMTPQKPRDSAPVSSPPPVEAP